MYMYSIDVTKTQKQLYIYNVKKNTKKFECECESIHSNAQCQDVLQIENGKMQ